MKTAFRFLITLLITNILVPTADAKTRAYREYSIAMLTDEACIEKAKQMNKTIAKRLPDLKNMRNYPNIPLFMVTLSSNDLGTVIKKLHTLRLKQFPVSCGQVYSDNNSKISWLLEKNEQLNALRKQVADLTAPYNHIQHGASAGSSGINLAGTDVEGTTTPMKTDQQSTPPEMVSAESFQPSIPLFLKMPADQRLHNISEEISQTNPQATCTINALVVGEVGYAGNMLKIVYRIPIEKGDK